jgi:hypothetical protein
MVHRDQRRVVHHRDRLCGGEADDDAADQAGTGGGRDRRQFGKLDARFVHGLCNDAVEQIDMGARRDLRHHAAEARVLLGLRADDVGQDPPRPVGLALDHGCGGLVAGGLDPQHQVRLAFIQFETLDPIQNAFSAPCAIGQTGVSLIA